MKTNLEKQLLLDYLKGSDLESLKLYEELKNPNRAIDTLLTEDMVFKKSKGLLECEAILDKMRSHAVKHGKDVKFRQMADDFSFKLGNIFNFSHLTVDFGAGVAMPLSAVIINRPAILTNPKGILSVILAALSAGALQPNAYTFKGAVDSLPRIISPLNSLVTDKTSEGLKFRGIGPAGYIHVSDRVFSDLSSSGEVLSIILHEIGHNFYVGSLAARAVSTVQMAVYSLFKILMFTVTKILSLVSDVVDDTVVGKVMVQFGAQFRKLMKNISNLPTSGELLAFLNIQKIIFACIGAKKLADSLMAAIDKLLIAFLNVFNNFFSKNILELASFFSMDWRAEEKFCDDFAAIHGYGGELSSALTFLQFAGMPGKYTEKQLPKSTLNQVYASLAIDKFFDLFIIFDPHPANAVRSVNMINTLKEFKAKAETPQERKFIDSQIDQIAKYSTKAYFSKAKKDLDEVKEKTALQYLVSNGYIGSTISEVIDIAWNSVSIFKSQGAGNTYNFVKSANDTTK